MIEEVTERWNKICLAYVDGVQDNLDVNMPAVEEGTSDSKNSSLSS